MSIPNPPILTPVPVAPNRLADDSVTFSNKADTFVAFFAPFGASITNFGNWAQTTGNTMHGYVLESANYRNQCISLRDETQTLRNQTLDYRNVAMNAVNFKGSWISLAGSLSVPSTVFHNGRYWVLLNFLSNVALQEPTTGNPNWAVVNDSAIINELLYQTFLTE